MIELLCEESNFAVVQLPGRKFPGVVIQGDSLYVLLCLADELKNSSDPAEAELLAEELVHLLRIKVDGYERVLNEKGIRLPYVRTKLMSNST